MKKVIIFSNLNINQINHFEDNSMIDVFLLDHLRTFTSQGNKSFAVVLDNFENDPKAQYVIIKDNCTLWMSAADFFKALN